MNPEAGRRRIRFFMGWARYPLWENGHPDYAMTPDQYALTPDLADDLAALERDGEALLDPANGDLDAGAYAFWHARGDEVLRRLRTQVAAFADVVDERTPPRAH